MTAARHIIALLKSHISGDEERFYTTALQLAAHEARLGHGKVASELKDLIDSAKSQDSAVVRKIAPVPLAQPKGELASLLTVGYPDQRLSEMVLPEVISSKLNRVLLEQRQQEELRTHGLRPRRKLLLIGPPRRRENHDCGIACGRIEVATLYGRS